MVRARVYALFEWPRRRPPRRPLPRPGVEYLEDRNAPSGLVDLINDYPADPLALEKDQTQKAALVATMDVAVASLAPAVIPPPATDEIALGPVAPPQEGEESGVVPAKAAGAFEADSEVAPRLAPRFLSFRCQETSPNWFTFAGRVTGPDMSDLRVDFSGLQAVSDGSAFPDTEGAFMVMVYIPSEQEGIVSAVARTQGQQSEVAQVQVTHSRA